MSEQTITYDDALPCDCPHGHESGNCQSCQQEDWEAEHGPILASSFGADARTAFAHTPGPWTGEPTIITLVESFADGWHVENRKTMPRQPLSATLCGKQFAPRNVSRVPDLSQWGAVCATCVEATRGNRN